MRALPRAGAGLALGAAAAWALPALAPIVPAVAGAMAVDRRAGGGTPGVALTFDDGPHPQGTPAVLEALERADARATFFLVGEQVRARRALAAEIVAAGHDVAIHGDRHRVMLRVPPRALAEDLDRAADAIAQATGRAPLLHRPPLGIYSHPGLAQVRRRGWHPMLWSRWGRDWSARSTGASVARLVTRDLTAGDVLLLHDADWYSDAGCWRATVAALPAIFDAIAARGLAPEPLR